MNTCAGFAVVQLWTCVSRPAKWLLSCWQLFAACTTIVQGLMTHGKHFRRITRVDRMPLVVTHMRRVAGRDALRTTKVNERYCMKCKLCGQWRRTVLAVKSEEPKVKRLRKLRQFINCLHKTWLHLQPWLWEMTGEVSQTRKMWLVLQYAKELPGAGVTQGRWMEPV